MSILGVTSTKVTLVVTLLDAVLDPKNSDVKMTRDLLECLKEAF